MLSDQETCEQLKAKLQSVYRAKEFLPQILEREDFSKRKIEDTYVNLMLIEVDKGKSEPQNKDEPGAKDKEKGGEEEKIYGSYEDILAKKTEIELENIFDSKSHPDKSEKEVNKVLIYGRAGVGKTTLCNYISYKWSQDKLWKGKFDYVFWLPLRSLTGNWYKWYKNKDIGKHALECFISRYCLDKDDSFSIQDISKVIKEGKMLLILDGYDEIASFHSENHIEIKDVIDSAIGISSRKAKVIMTSRPNAVGQILRNSFDAEVENMGLKEKDVYEYVEYRYKFKKQGQAEGLSALLKQHGHIKSMVQVPINLYLLCVIWSEGSLKNQSNITVTGLYEEVVEWLMKRYLSKSKAKKLAEIDFDGAEKACEEEYNLLEKLAYCGTKERTAILGKEACQTSEIDWSKLSTLKKLGILSGKGVEEGTREYEFIHLTFQEYFAAKHIVKLLRSRDLEKVKEAVKFINENKYNSVYERVILFIAGLVTQELPKGSGKQVMKYFWNVMLNGEIDLRVIKQLVLLIRCLEEGKCSEEIPGIDKILETIKQYSLQDFYQFEQTLIISQQVLHKSRLVESFIDKFENPDGGVRCTAATVLSKLKPRDEQVGKAMAASLCKALEDPNKDVREAAASTLGELKLYDVGLTKAVMVTLCKTLEDTNGQVCVAAANALEKLKPGDEQIGKAVAAALCKALEDPNKWVRKEAISTLMQLKLGDVDVEKSVAVALCKALEDLYEWVRSAAAYALMKLKLNNMEVGKVMVVPLLKALGDPNKSVCRAVAYALGRLKLDDVEVERAVAVALCKTLDEDPNKDVRSAAAYALGKLKLNDVELVKAIAAALCKALEDPNEEMRRTAAYALSRLKLDDVEATKAVTIALCKVLEDTDEGVLRGVAYALNKLKLDYVEIEEAVVVALYKALENPNQNVRIAAADALGKLKLDDAALAKAVSVALCKALEDTDKYVCIRATQALVQLNPGDAQLTKTVVEALCKSLENPDQYVRIAASDALRQLKLDDVEIAKAAVVTLCKAIEDSNWGVRSAATYALRHLKLDDAELIKAVAIGLCKALENPNKKVRKATASALMKLKLDDVEIAEAVTIAWCKALEDSEEGVRCVAAYALWRSNLDGVKAANAAVVHSYRILEDDLMWSAIAYALRRSSLDDIATKIVVPSYSVLQGLNDKLSSISIDDLHHVLWRGNDKSLQEEMVEYLLTPFQGANKVAHDDTVDAFDTMDALREFDIVNRKAQLQIAEALIENLPLEPKSYYEYQNCLDKVLEKCAINDIKLPLTSRSIKLLELSYLKILQESAIVLSSNCLTLYYGEHKLVFEFDKSDKELQLKVLEHFKKKAEKEGLPTEMLDTLITGRKWIEIEGIDTDIDKVISSRITKAKEDIMIIKDNLELSIISGAEILKDDLVMVCTNKSGPHSGIESYLKQNKSLYSGDNKHTSQILIVAMTLAHEKSEYIEELDGIIKVLCKKSVGLSAVDGIGNTVAHYAVRYHRKDVLEACMNSGDYSKDIANTFGVNILHTAVYYNMVGELDDKLGEQNLDFDKQAISGKYTFTPIELAVAIGNIEAIEKIWDMNKSIAASSKWCKKNILNVAIDFKKDEVLHYLIYEKKYDISANLIQDGYVYASIAGGEGNINAMRILQGSFVKAYKSCSISKWSSVTGNTALHEVVSCDGVGVDKKCIIINYLLGQESGLADAHNKNNQTAKELAKDNKIRNLLTIKKGFQDSKKHEMPELGKVPIKNLILKGGGPKGIAYIGALREFEKIQKEEGWTEIERVAGTSAGAITAGLYAIGYTAEELEKDLTNTKLIELLDSPNIEKLMKLKDINSPWAGVSNLFKEQGSTGHKLLFEVIETLGEYNGLCTGNKFEEIIEGLIEKKTGKKNFTLGDLGEKVRKGENGYKELYVVTLNMLNQENPLVILSTEEENYREIRLTDAIRASMSIPVVFAPKELKYRDRKSGEYKVLRCIDGGVMYNYPIDIFDKVKFRHTGIRGKGEKPIYNEYTMGLSLYSKEIEHKQEIKAPKERETVGQRAAKEAIEAGVKIAEELFKWLTTEDLKELQKEVIKINKVALKVISILGNAEEAMRKYWRDSIEVRTVEIGSGIGLLDFDLNQEAIDTLMKEGAMTVNQRFGKEIGQEQGAPKVEMQRLAAAHEITPKSSSKASITATTPIVQHISTSSLSAYSPNASSTTQMSGLDDIHVGINDKQARRGDCRLF